jgi:predicted lipoprotein with Yx(FWY)xxD motif
MTTSTSTDTDVASSRPLPDTPRPGRRRLGWGGAVAAAALAAVALVAAACGSSNNSAGNTTTSGASSSSSTTGSSSSSHATVKTASTANFGTILVNSQGMALYTLNTDHGGQSTCTGSCAQAWPALTVPSGTTPTGGSGVTGTLGTSAQSNGTLQVTYNGALLYTFTSDSPGQVTGNGVVGFSVVKVSASPAGAAGTTTSTSAGRGGY